MFVLYVRSVLAANTASSVRPSDCDCYIQLDIWKKDLLDSDVWPKNIKEVKRNVLFNSISEVGTVVYAAVPFKGIYDSFICLDNNEVTKQLSSFEDGRSRRYFVDTGLYASMISFKIGLLHLPVSIERLNSDEKFGMFKMNIRRLTTISNYKYELDLVYLGGKFHADYKAIKVGEYTKALRQFMLLADIMHSDSKSSFRKANKNTVGFIQIILLGLDHSAKIDALDIDSFLFKYGKKWNMPPKSAMYSDPISQSGWLGVHGWMSNDERVSVDIVMHDYDDHSPAMYYLRGPIFAVSPSEERKYMAKYFLSKKMNLGAKYMMHDGKKMSEAEYQIWRKNHAIDW